MTKYLASTLGALIAIATCSSAHAAALVINDFGTVSSSLSAPLVGSGLTITGYNDAPIVSGGGQNVGTVVAQGDVHDGTVGWNPFGTASTASPPNDWFSLGGKNGEGNPSYLDLALTKAEQGFIFVWGSSSVTNTVKLFDNSTLVGSVQATGNASLNVYNGSGSLVSTYSNANLANTSGAGALIGIFSGTVFNKIELSTGHGNGGFELGDLSVSPVPLPGALLLFATGLLPLAGLAIRKSRFSFAARVGARAV